MICVLAIDFQRLAFSVVDSMGEFDGRSVPRGERHDPGGHVGHLHLAQLPQRLLRRLALLVERLGRRRPDLPHHLHRLQRRGLVRRTHGNRRRPFFLLFLSTLYIECCQKQETLGLFTKHG